MAGSVDIELGTVHRPIPAEFRGMGRVFLAKVKASHLAHNRLLNDFSTLIQHRAVRYPERGIPAKLLQDIGREWNQSADPYRIGFVNKLKNCKGAISECRIGYSGL